MTSRRLFLEPGQRSDPWSTTVLTVLAIFTALALAGYWFFGLHPQNLARFPSSASFYAVSYSFFAQSQVWLSGVVLLLFLVRSAGWKWITGFVLVYVLSLSSELAGTNTGFPFGEYRYTSLLGTKWFDHVPVVIPLSWFTMVLPAHIITGRLTEWSMSRPMHWLLTGILLTIWDLALDPAMSYLVIYWEWGVEGAYYGMPWVNLAGWLFTGVILSFALDQTGVREWEARLSSRWLTAYYVILFALPFGMLVAAGAWPAAVFSITVLVIALEIYGRLGTGSRSAAGTSDTSHGAPSDERGVEDVDGLDNHAYLASVIDAASQNAWGFFRDHSRSFSFSSRLFSKANRRLVTSLYVFCRITDDLADNHAMPPDRRAALLHEWRSILRSAYDEGESGFVWLNELAGALRASGMPFSVIDALVDGVLSDTGRVRVLSTQELKDYSYSVASTVGIMMCYLFGERDSWKLSRAAALGRGMQITNILRDVKTDLLMDRVYIPLEILSAHGLSVDDLHELVRLGPAHRGRDSRLDAYKNVLETVAKMADEEYDRAWEAIPRLPASFGLSVAVAASVYRGIMGKLRSDGYDNLSRRIATGSIEKAWLAACGLARYGYSRLRRPWAHSLVETAHVKYREQGP